MKELNRYLFTVRQPFNESPHVDCFYKVASPSGMTSEQFKVMSTLKPGWESESLKADTNAMHGMEMRSRFNSDMYSKICLVRTDIGIDLTAEMLDDIIESKFKQNILGKFLDESAV